MAARVSKPAGLLLVVLAGWMAACRPVAVTRQVVVEPRPSATPAICTPLPPGMRFSAIPTSPATVQVTLTGLEPGDNLVLLFSASSNGYSSQIEFRPAQPIGPDGRFTYEGRGLFPSPGSTMNRWEIQVVHSRGVACAEVTLP